MNIVASEVGEHGGWIPVEPFNTDGLVKVAAGPSFGGGTYSEFGPSEHYAEASHRIEGVDDTKKYFIWMSSQ